MPHSHENDDSFLSPVTATLPGMDSHDARTCVIFGAGDYYDETPAIPDDAFVVAAWRDGMASPEISVHWTRTYPPRWSSQAAVERMRDMHVSVH